MLFFRNWSNALLFLLTALPSASAADNLVWPLGDADKFRVWATSCAHVQADLRRGRESLALAIRQSEGFEQGVDGFSWDIMVDAGDLTAESATPSEEDGKDVIRQYRALRNHRREQIYNVPGNHDAPYYDHGPGSWFRKWGDPLGENTRYSGVDPRRRPFPVEGTWERYRFQAGNILFLMLADRNDAPTPVGRGHSDEGHDGGYPSGAVTRETFDWWKQQVLANQDKIIVTVHHHALRDTTTASSRLEGHPRYHSDTGGDEGASYLYYIIEKDDPEDFRYTGNAHVFEDFLGDFHQKNGRGAIDFWIAGHTHVKGPDDVWGGKSISETRWGVNFLQVAALTKHWVGSHPLSRLLTFTDESDLAQVDAYLHDGSYSGHPVGLYAPATRVFLLRHAFEAPPAIASMEPFPETAMVFGERKSGSRPTLESIRARAAKRSRTDSRWDPRGKGSLDLVSRLTRHTQDETASRPRLISLSPFETGRSAYFEGNERVRVDFPPLGKKSGLTVSAWIATTSTAPGMRVVSKDRIGKKGDFTLWYDLKGNWSMRAWDRRARTWRTASWESRTINDGSWHLLTGVVDPREQQVLLYVDGELKAVSPWKSGAPRNTKGLDLVIGADSGKKQVGHGFVGMIHQPRLYSRALDAGQVRTLFEARENSWGMPVD